MPTAPLETVLWHVRALANAELTDEQLLKQCVKRRDEAAFAILMPP